MDWTTIRVLSKNLAELFGEMAQGRHIITLTTHRNFPLKQAENAAERGTELDRSWWLRMTSVTNSLAQALNVEYRFPTDPPQQWSGWEGRLHDEHSIRTARGLLELAQKLLTELEEQQVRERTVRA